MVYEPQISQAPGGRGGSVGYEGRWRWWYSSISDWMIRNPGRHMTDCAAELHKNLNTITSIVNTDLFRDYHAARRREFQQGHDDAIKSKLTAVAEASLDNILATMEAKKATIPIETHVAIATSVLDRLGYGPNKTPSVVVNAGATTDNRVQVLQVNASTLEEARTALRRAEQLRVESRQRAPMPVISSSGSGGSAAGEPLQVLEVEALESFVEELEASGDSVPRDS